MDRMPISPTTRSPSPGCATSRMRCAPLPAQLADPPEPVRARLARAWRRRPVAIAWAASLVAVGILVGVTVYGAAAVRPVSPVTGATQVASLTERDRTAPEWLDDWWGGDDSDVTAYEFRGLTAVRAEFGLFSQGSDCLTLVQSDGVGDDGSIEGNIYSGCRAGAFPAVVQFTIDSSSPEAIQAEFGLGTAVQFVLDGDTIGVFVDASAQEADTGSD